MPILLLVLALIALPVVAEYYSCGARWSDSGMATSWGPIQGCKVKTPDGRWIPEDRYREVP